MLEKKVHPNDQNLYCSLSSVLDGISGKKPTHFSTNDEMDDSGSSFRFKCKSVKKERKKEREREKVCVCVCELKRNWRNEQKPEGPMKLAGSAARPA
jgi:hypothetical protein